MGSEFTHYISDAESKSKTYAERASRAAGRKGEADRLQREADEWKQEAAFLKTLQAIFELQTGVPIPNENFSVKQTGKGDAKRWDHTSDPGKFEVQEWKEEAQGSFCHGAARAMALRALFGENRPSNKKILEDLRDEIKQAEDDKTKAEAIIDRICTHSGVHPLGWTGVSPFKWQPAGRVPLQT